jgi:CDP-diacylglycerol--glycerol-3-phosphate 3-phosphatidyltransferase
MAERGQRAAVKVGQLGKVKTACQMVATILLLAACPGASDFDMKLALGVSPSSVLMLGLGLLYLATALTLVSGVQYLVAAWPVLTADALNPNLTTPQQATLNNEDKSTPS